MKTLLLQKIEKQKGEIQQEAWSAYIGACRNTWWNNEKIKIGVYRVCKHFQGYLYRGFIEHYHDNIKLYRQIININRLSKEDALNDAIEHYKSYLIANSL